jgi:Zn-dependent protease with chaperone function
MKLLFIPFSVFGGLLSGFLAKKLFEQAWGVVDDQEPPKPTHREVPVAKVVAAAALEGAIFKGTRAVIDHKSRQAFASATGTWPGETRPEQE